MSGQVELYFQWVASILYEPFHGNYGMLLPLDPIFPPFNGHYQHLLTWGTISTQHHHGTIKCSVNVPTD